MKYFTIEELCHSYRAMTLKINNRPNQTVINNLTNLVDNVLDPLREAYGKPIVVSSGYRCFKLNKSVGGVSNSNHLYGYAADIRSKSGLMKETKDIYDLVCKLGLKYTELIWEHDKEGNYWVHISYNPNKLEMRNVSNLLKK